MKLLLDIKDINELFVDSVDVMANGGKWSAPGGYYQILCSGGMLLTDSTVDGAMWLARYGKPSPLVLKAYQELVSQFKGLSEKSLHIRCFNITPMGESYIVSMYLGEVNFNLTLAVVPSVTAIRNIKR